MVEVDRTSQGDLLLTPGVDVSQRDYDPNQGLYLESDPIGFDGGINSCGYAANNPLAFIDPEGLTERGGGQKGIGGNDPLIPRDINRNTPRDEVQKAIDRIKDAIKRMPGTNPARKRALEAWVKVAKRGLTKALVCPPLDQDLVMNTLRESCIQGDMLSCQLLADLSPDDLLNRD